MSAGIAIMEQSVKELGQAFSGAPTNVSDGSMVFFNPAAMSQVRSRLVTSAGYLLIPFAEFHNQSSTTVSGAPLRGGDGGNFVGPSMIPNFYYVHPLTNRITFGMGFNVPFAAHNSYHSDWKGRYQAIDSEVAAFNFNPSLSLKVTEKLSLGAGFNIQYLTSKFTNAIDLGTACVGGLGASVCAPQGLLPQQADGHLSLKSDNVGFGYNVGAFYALNPKIQLGASYRSRVTHHLDGHANFSVPGNAMILTRRNSFVDTDTQTSVTLPDSVLFGFSYRIHPRWAFSADALWTHWSLIRELRTDFKSSQVDDVQPMNWRDTWRYAGGVNYFTDNGKWIFRTGFAYDETPIPNPENRSARLPDSNRYWLTAGVTYAIRKNISIHGAYAHLFFEDPTINRRGTTGEMLRGRYTEQVNILGLQLDWRF
ncbi:MAG: aromatic hydrocarbon degradation protein [Proteobacteria bacterium SG_bin4]|nr:MAG: aromatic hydrocarbon degradation protein [Proteobacteria bacterium SG_bin4]